MPWPCVALTALKGRCEAAVVRGERRTEGAGPHSLRTGEAGFKERLDRVEDGLPGMRLIDALAQRCPARYAMGKPGGELLHLALRFLLHGTRGRLAQEHTEVRTDEIVAVRL